MVANFLLSYNFDICVNWVLVVFLDWVTPALNIYNIF